MWYIMQSIQSKYSLSERLIRTIAAIRSFPHDNVEDLIGRVRPHAGGVAGEGSRARVPPGAREAYASGLSRSRRPVAGCVDLGLS